MDASRNILIFNFTPIFYNKRDFSYLFIYLFIFIYNFGASKRLWQSGQEGNLWADSGGGVLLARQSRQGEREFF